MSDGEKCTMALLGDLARRLTLANPTLENPLLGKGIVLIDEIELHMHPSWQRKILSTLKNTFPNVQFMETKSINARTEEFIHSIYIDIEQKNIHRQWKRRSG